MLKSEKSASPETMVASHDPQSNSEGEFESENDASTAGLSRCFENSPSERIMIALPEEKEKKKRRRSKKKKDKKGSKAEEGIQATSVTAQTTTTNAVSRKPDDPSVASQAHKPLESMSPDERRETFESAKSRESLL